MARKSNCTMTFKGHEEILKDIERIGGNIPKEIEKAVEKAGALATDEYKKVISQHRYSGLTEETLVSNVKAENEGTKIICKTGFDIKKGGLASILLDRGTPKNKPLKFVQKIKRSKEIQSVISTTLEEAWRKLIK